LTQETHTDGPRPGGADDTITAEVIRNALTVAVEEASIVVVRSSHSAWIQEGADAAAALLDAEGQLVAQSTATSLMHAASIRTTARALIAEVPTSTMRPGDVWALNDPYRGGIHANDILVFRPVFAGGAVHAIAGTVIHVADLGGVAVGGLASLANDTFAEGVLLPPVRLYIDDRTNDDVFAILHRNSRAPDKVVGDIKALVAGVNVIARRMDELVERYGLETLHRHMDAYLDYAERRMRDELAKIPDGAYEGSFTIDSDGVETDRTFDVKVRVTVTGGDVEIDFTGTDGQSAGSINSSLSQTLSGVVFAMRCFVDPSIPMNDGCFRPISTVLPLGTLVNPRPPAACGGRVVTVAAAVDAIINALGKARPDHAVAPSALIQVFTLGGRDHGRPWLNMFYEFGGIGARNGGDGPNATGPFFLGGRSVIPQYEPLEAQFPLMVVSSRLAADSGGPGQWRGGLGVDLRIRLLEDAVLTVRGDRLIEPPPGVMGGEPGRPGSFAVERANGDVEPLAARQQGIELKPGDILEMRTSGGGGLGPASRRDVAAVEADVADGLVSAAEAERDYRRQGL
jgi:N-methylhydantoinase B